MMHRNRRLILPVLAAFVVAIAISAASVGFLAPVAPAEAQGAPTGVSVQNGATAGEVVVSWTPAAGAVKNRIGWASEPEVLEAQAAGDWLEAFYFVDIAPGKRTFTVKRLQPGVRHAFLVATIPNAGNPVYSQWQLLTTTAGSTAACPTPGVVGTPTPTPRPTLAPTPVPTATPAVQGPLTNQQIIRLVKPALGQVVVPGGSGTGFVVRSTGLMVTNRHVVEDAQTVTVYMQNLEGQLFEYTGSVLGRGILADLAVIQLPAGRTYPSLPLANSDSVEPGEEVIAMGYPKGSISGTYPVPTDGIISSRPNYAFDVKHFQTTATINPGNSGGPLVNRQGAVVGVNTWKRTDVDNTFFAIVSNEVSDRLDTMAGGGPRQETYRSRRFGHGYTVTVPQGWYLGSESPVRTNFKPYEGYGIARVKLWDFRDSVPADADFLEAIANWRWRNLNEQGNDDDNEWLLFAPVSSQSFGNGAGRYYRLEYRRQATAEDCVQNRVEIIAAPSRYPGRRYALSLMAGVCEGWLAQKSAERQAILNSFVP